MICHMSPSPRHQFIDVKFQLHLVFNRLSRRSSLPYPRRPYSKLRVNPVLMRMGCVTPERAGKSIRILMAESLATYPLHDDVAARTRGYVHDGIS